MVSGFGLLCSILRGAIGRGPIGGGFVDFEAGKEEAFAFRSARTITQGNGEGVGKGGSLGGKGGENKFETRSKGELKAVT